MNQEEKAVTAGSLPTARGENIRFYGAFSKKQRIFAAFLILIALAVAGVSIAAVYLSAADNEAFKHWNIFGKGEPGEDSVTPTEPPAELENTNDEIKTPVVIPSNAVPIKSEDISFLNLGNNYIHNQSGFTPNIEALRSMPLERYDTKGQPLVLILHTHTSESYLPADTGYIEGELGDATYSSNAADGVRAVGEALYHALNREGIPTIFCATSHDDPTLRGAYERSAESIRFYLEQYPTIRYVFDLHRDAVINSEGEYIRSVTSYKGEEIAQILPVVGSDANGTVHPEWENNLALALQLRETLNELCPGICRPVSLRAASYNQELSKYSLLFEIGTGANSKEEALRAAEYLAEALKSILLS